MSTWTFLGERLCVPKPKGLPLAKHLVVEFLGVTLLTIFSSVSGTALGAGLATTELCENPCVDLCVWISGR